MKPRLLLVAYYFPPHNFVGAYRPLRLARYLHRHGWEITVLSARGPEKRRRDPELLRFLPEDVMVFRVPSPEGGEPNAGRTALFRKFIRETLNLLMFPDKKVLWALRAARASAAIINRGKPDVVFVTAPPYSALITGLIASRYGVPWVTDFRDAWVRDALDAYRTPIHRELAAKGERWAVRRAATCTFVNRRLMHDVMERNPTETHKFVLVRNGFDPEMLPHDVPVSREFTISYIGTLYGHRKPHILLRGVAEFRKMVPDAEVRLNFVGRSEFDIVEAAVELGVPAEWVKHIDFLSYSEAARIGMSSTALWLVVSPKEKAAPLTAPGKLYDYIGFMRPIISSVPNGIVAEIVSALGDSFVVNPNDVRGLAGAIAELYRRFQSGQLTVNREARMEYHIAKSAAVLDEVLRRAARLPR